VITPTEVAGLLQIHVKTVYRLARRGILPGRQIGRRWRFSRTEILALLSNQGAGGRAPMQSLELPPDAQ
jgi:excisionase family DNA binding protein